MQRHWCEVEQTWLDFEGICNWCEMNEPQAKRQMQEYYESEKNFKEVMEKVEKNARPDITDD